MDDTPARRRGLLGVVLDPTHEQTRAMARVAGPAFVIGAVALVPWALYLLATLPSRELAHNYDIAWAGFDLALVAAMLATTWSLVRLSRLLPIAASVLGAMLVVDAWFDVVMSVPGVERTVALVMGLAVELPFAAVAFWLAYHGQALRERAIAVRLVRAVRTGGRLDRTLVHPLVRPPGGSTRPWWATLVASVVLQALVVYWPSSPHVPDGLPVDKLVHLAIFALPAALVPFATTRRTLPWALLAAHAPVSEWLQHAVLPHRSGDPADLLADLAGVALGVVVGLLARRRVGGRTRTGW